MDINLKKKADNIDKILLAKGVKKAPIMRVGAALDISGSMDSLINTGALQNAFNQLMGVSVKFDDNGELDVFKFNENCTYVGTSAPDKGDYDQYIKHNNIHAGGGTNYAPIIRAAHEFFFTAKKTGGFLGFGGKTEPVNNMPVLMMILTDGEPYDAAETERAMRDAEKEPIYFHMVGIGGDRKNFHTIAHLADALPNVGEVYLPRLNMTDDEIYEQLICDELIEFIGRFAAAGLQQATA